MTFFALHFWNRKKEIYMFFDAVMTPISKNLKVYSSEFFLNESMLQTVFGFQSIFERSIEISYCKRGIFIIKLNGTNQVGCIRFGVSSTIKDWRCNDSHNTMTPMPLLCNDHGLHFSVPRLCNGLIGFRHIFILLSLSHWWKHQLEMKIQHQWTRNDLNFFPIKISYQFLEYFIRWNFLYPHRGHALNAIGFRNIWH